MHMEHATKGERRVARKLVRAILERGGVISVNDGEEWTVKQSGHEPTILAALCTTGQDTLRWREHRPDGKHLPVAAFLLIWGNAEDGSELIADHADNDAAEEVYREVIGEGEDA